MNTKQLKRAVGDELIALGADVDPHAFETMILRDCVKLVYKQTKRHRGKQETMYQYLYSFAMARKKDTTRTLPAFRELRVVPHPRAAEIDAAQPHFMSIASNPSTEKPPWIESRNQF